MVIQAMQLANRTRAISCRSREAKTVAQAVSLDHVVIHNSVVAFTEKFGQDLNRAKILTTDKKNVKTHMLSTHSMAMMDLSIMPLSFHNRIILVMRAAVVV